MTLKMFKKRPALWFYLGGAVLVLLAVILWCTKVSIGTERVFWATIERGMATYGVTIQSEQSNSGTSAKQTVRYSLGAENLSHSVTKLSQANTVVVNEMFGTPDTDYTRYLSIKTDQKKADGTPIDVSKLLGVWARGQAGSGQLFVQAVFGASLPVGGMVVPIGNLPSEKRAVLIKQIRDDAVYQVSFDKVKKERVGGRLLYTYQVNMRPSAYVALMKKFAQSIGLHGLDQLDPKTYESQKPFKVHITIDARARQVVRVTEPENGGKQTYSSYGVPVQIAPPEKAITGAELQKLLSNLQ